MTPPRLRVLRKYFRKYLPTTESIHANRWLGAFVRLLDHPGLWAFNRRSVAGAVAIGLFAGLVPGPLQMVTAALLAGPLRRNLPVALLCTLYTNPFTIVPLYVLAFGYGQWLIGTGEHRIPEPFTTDWSQLSASLAGLLDWTLSLGKPLAVGLVALALTLAVLGYLAVDLGWRAWVRLQWRARAARRRKGIRP